MPPEAPPRDKDRRLLLPAVPSRVPVAADPSRVPPMGTNGSVPSPRRRDANADDRRIRSSCRRPSSSSRRQSSCGLACVMRSSSACTRPSGDDDDDDDDDDGSERKPPLPPSWPRAPAATHQVVVHDTSQLSAACAHVEAAGSRRAECSELRRRRIEDRFHLLKQQQVFVLDLRVPLCSGRRGQGAARTARHQKEGVEGGPLPATKGPSRAAGTRRKSPSARAARFPFRVRWGNVRGGLESTVGRMPLRARAWRSSAFRRSQSATMWLAAGIVLRSMYAMVQGSRHRGGDRRRLARRVSAS